jgi:hypothetical protein
METAGQSYGDRVGDRIHCILTTYSGADIRSLLIDASGLVALVMVTLKSKLYERMRLVRLLATGDIQT